MLASKRLPASRAAPVSMALPLYQSVAVPELWPSLKQVRRAETLIFRASPVLMGTGVRLNGIEFRIAPLKALPPLLILLSWLWPTFVSFTNTSANRSSLKPMSSLFFRPTQSLAGLSPVSILGVGVLVGVVVGI